MKLDSESVYHHTDPSPDDDPKPKVTIHNGNHFILTKDNYFMVDMLDVEIENLKEGKHGLTSPTERKSSEFADQPKYYLNMDEDPLNKNDNESMEAPNSIPTSGFGIVVKEDFYSDNIVTKIEEQAVSVCIKDDSCQIVKDVSIDGVQLSEKSSVKLNEMDENESYVSIQSLDDLHNDSASGIFENLADAASLVCNDSNGKRSCLSLIKIGDTIDKAELMASNLSSDAPEYPEDAASIILNDFDRKRDSASPLESGDKGDTIKSAVSIISSEKINTDPVQVDSSGFVFVNDQKEKLQGISEDSICTSTDLSLTSQVSDLSNGSKKIPANCKVPNDVITFKFDNEAVSTSGEEEIEKSTDDRHSTVVALSGPETEEEAIVDDARVSSRSFYHLLQAEPNSHEPFVFSGPIANSGHIAYSGSISLRSTSSTTSARSFAFPILQSEWNSSPVKMAKADRRHLRRHRGWRMGGLLCCKF